MYLLPHMHTLTELFWFLIGLALATAALTKFPPPSPRYGYYVAGFVLFTALVLPGTMP